MIGVHVELSYDLIALFGEYKIHDGYIQSGKDINGMHIG